MRLSDINGPHGGTEKRCLLNEGAPAVLLARSVRHLAASGKVVLEESARRGRHLFE